MRRILCISLLVVTTGSPTTRAVSQQPESGIWFGLSPTPAGASSVGRFQLEGRPTGVAIRWVPFGKAPGSWGAIALRPDSSIEFNWADSPPLLCVLRRADARNYEGACQGAGKIQRGLMLTRDAQPFGLELPISETDFQILARARKILSGPSVWNRHDDRACEDDAKQNSWSLYCALFQASLDVTGQLLPSRPVMGEARGAVGVESMGRVFDHLLMDYNNLESTTYGDIAAAFARTETRLQARKTCAEHGSEWSDVQRDSRLIAKSNAELDTGFVAYWNEPITYTVQGEAYRLAAIVGPLNSTGRVWEDWLAESTAVTLQTWKWRDFVGVDAKGELRSGNRWRYFAQCGDFLVYYNVPTKAAAYFDRVLDGAYFLDRRRDLPPHDELTGLARRKNESAANKSEVAPPPNER